MKKLTPVLIVFTLIFLSDVSFSEEIKIKLDEGYCGEIIDVYDTIRSGLITPPYDPNYNTIFDINYYLGLFVVKDKISDLKFISDINEY